MGMSMCPPCISEAYKISNDAWRYDPEYTGSKEFPYVLTKIYYFRNKTRLVKEFFHHKPFAIIQADVVRYEGLDEVYYNHRREAV